MAALPPGHTQKPWFFGRGPLTATHLSTESIVGLWRFSQAKFTPPIFLFWNLRGVCEWQPGGLHKNAQNAVSTSEVFVSTSSCLHVWVCLENILKKSQNVGKWDLKIDQVQLSSLGRDWNKGTEKKGFYLPKGPQWSRENWIPGLRLFSLERLLLWARTDTRNLILD